MDLGFGPKEGASGVIVAFDERADVRREFFDSCEGSAGERPGGEDREPDFDLAKPRGVGRRVMEMNVLMALEPHVAGGLVSGQIVENDVDLALRISGDHPVHEVEELDAAASLIVAGADPAAAAAGGGGTARG